MTIGRLLTFSLLWLASFGNAFAKDAAPAEFHVKDEKVRFWQTNHLSGGTGGVCLITFGFEAEALSNPIENLTLSIRVINKVGIDLGFVKLTLSEPLGGSRAERFREATFGNTLQWPDHDDISPLCYKETTLIVESAVGNQSGKVIDLVRFGQLEFTAFPRLNIKVKK